MKTAKDPVLSRDLTQDTFLEILQTIEKLQEPAAFPAWSRQIAYHRCTAHFKKRKDVLLDEESGEGSLFDSVMEGREEFIPHETLDKEELPQEQRTAVIMRY